MKPVYSSTGSGLGTAVEHVGETPEISSSHPNKMSSVI